jgi:hypothetical protein
MGRPAARPARTPSRNAHAHQGNLPGGERLLWPSSHAARGVVGQRRAATSPPQPARPIPLRRALLPLRRLDREAYSPRSGLCWALTYPHWAFAPFTVRHRKGRREGEVGKKEGGAGERGRPRDAADAPRPETAPVAARKEGEAPALEKKSDRSRDQDGAVNIYVAMNIYAVVNTYATPPSTPIRPRLHRRPNMSTPRPSSSSLPPCLLSSAGSATSRCAAGTLTLPVCWPSSHSPGAPRRVGAPGLVMPPSSSSPCDEPMCSPAFVPCISCAGDEVRRSVASSRAPDLQVVAPGEHGSAGLSC